jgi:predicted O-methyltransferase YrrM
MADPNRSGTNQLMDEGGESESSAPQELTLRLAPEDIAALAKEISQAKARLAREDIVALAREIAKALHEKFRSPNFQFDVLHRLPYSQDSAAYVAEHMRLAMKIPGKQHHLEYALSKIGDGLILEFGVFKGQSINQIAAVVDDRQVHGFDSFEGLPEDWSGYNVEAVAFDQQGRLPQVRENVTLHKGWFDETLPAFLAEHPEDVAFVHVDCDIYSSAKTVLSELANRIKPGTVLVFDEYHNYPYWREHEHRAFMEFCSEHGVEFEYISYNNLQAAAQVKALEGRAAEEGGHTT